MEVALDLLKARTKICCIIINIHGDGDIQFQNSLKIFIKHEQNIMKTSEPFWSHSWTSIKILWCK